MGTFGGDVGERMRPGFAGRIEVRQGATGRREWSEATKGRIVQESLEPGASVKNVAHRHGLAPQQLTTWRRAARQGRLALSLSQDLTAEKDLGFATLVVAEDSGPEPLMESGASRLAVEIVAKGVVVRLDGATPATRIAEIVAAVWAQR